MAGKHTAHLARWGGVLLVGAISATASGCAASSSGQGDPSLDFSLSYPVAENSPYEVLAERYMDEHRGAKVTLNPIPAENYDSVLGSQLQGGMASDVIMVIPGAGSPVSIGSLSGAGLLAPLSGDAEDLVPDSAHSLFFVDGEMYGQPTDLSVTATIFNQAAGVQYPTSVDEMLSSCRSLSDRGIALYAVAGAIPINSGLLGLVAAAPLVYGDDPEWDAKRAAGEVTFAESSGWREAFELIIEMKDAGCFQPGAEGGDFGALVGSLGQGTALGAFVPAGAATEMAAGMPDADIVVEPFPTRGDGAATIYSSMDYALSIPTSATHKPAAQAFLDWFAEPEQAQAYAEAAGTLPVTGIEDFDFAGTPYEPVADLLTAGDVVVMPVNVWTSARVFDALGSGVQGLLTGQVTVDQLLAQLDSAWDE
ncbi:Bacterial extracellular solute-binding protein [Microbacterium hydrocarbonoxydans]|uniref:Bacterial extracellular solute-binding protein n=1 Tax=Microbacterium hydrocarbonoxydans TaxID=273678 RepID=A0A0M2HKW9_9MICO|nr:extracellular solute-binding protein [Microbacterium hydrocarbonoxydans]KJL47331.1 Bacterial extracellular solute-binding protein [Microbacterium hydrocarbonoxydans]